ncbi:hypothetical protein [Ruegeria sp. HKCCE3926]|uniref:hypothetical protein n=1 Tax=Ruegeria sp. HKCCE3926 TaxID=2794831 RepID=UPI001AE85AA7|nr:hypothetical protein [Ruegeria sp. HKCCE3926]
MNAILKYMIALAGASFPASANADFIDTQWSVVGFTGEAWFIDAQDVIGQSQTFNRGFAEGVFYNCDYAGQSSTYTRYDNDEFFANPEFELFLPLHEEMTLSSDTLFVHRITCEGEGNPAQRRVMYPFVTNEARKSAWYLFEGGVFSLYKP